MKHNLIKELRKFKVKKEGAPIEHWVVFDIRVLAKEVEKMINKAVKDARKY